MLEIISLLKNFIFYLRPNQLFAERDFTRVLKTVGQVSREIVFKINFYVSRLNCLIVFQSGEFDSIEKIW